MTDKKDKIDEQEIVKDESRVQQSFDEGGITEKEVEEIETVEDLEEEANEIMATKSVAEESSQNDSSGGEGEVVKEATKEVSENTELNKEFKNN